MKTILESMCRNDANRHRMMFFMSSVQVVFSAIVMAVLRIEPIFWLNVIGFGILVFLYFVVSFRKTPFLYASFIAYASVSILLTTSYMESTYGFAYYLVLIVPFGFVFLYGVVSFQRMLASVTAGAVVTVATYVVYQRLLARTQPISLGSEAFQSWVHFVNLFLIVAILFVFSLMFAVRLECSKEREKAMLEQLAFESFHDALTGLFNRKHLDVAFSLIQSSNHDLNVLLCDLNDFKKINDE